MDVLRDFWHVTFTALLGMAGSVGAIALASPKLFAQVASLGNQTVFHGHRVSLDQRQWDIDTFVFSHGRLFGLLVVTTVAYIWLLSYYGPEACPQSLLLTVVIVAFMMGILALQHIMWQSQQIRAHQAEAHSDTLTGLSNRRAFDKELSRRLAQHYRQDIPLCLLILDVDHFKSFNDTLGHQAGDQVIRQVACTLEDTARQMDIVARLGGDEFAVLLPDCDLASATCVAERFRTAISASTPDANHRNLKLTVSIGLARAQRDDTPAAVVQRADSALYAAKEAGRNCTFRQGGPEPAALTRCE